MAKLNSTSHAEPGNSREEYSYPTVTQTSNGVLHAAFTYRHQTIKEVELDEAWIKKGSTMGLYKDTKTK